MNNPPENVFHDSSWKANDKVRPRTVVISNGGSVEFDVEGFHQVAVCGEGGPVISSASATGSGASLAEMRRL